MAEKIKLHAVIPESTVNGPGTRMVIFFQGCAKLCPGCFNTETHTFEPSEVLTPEELFEKYHTGNIEGITVSGGEPFLQPEALYDLLQYAKEKLNLSTVVYTGFRADRIKQRAEERRCAEHIDVLIDGGFEEANPETTLIARGSTNQEFYFVTERYSIEDFYLKARTELIVADDGTVRSTGFARVTLPKDSAGADSPDSTGLPGSSSSL